MDPDGYRRARRPREDTVTEDIGIVHDHLCGCDVCVGRSRGLHGLDMNDLGDDEPPLCDCAKWDGQGTDEPHERGAHDGCVFATPDTERSGQLTPAGRRALDDAERRAEGRRQRAEYEGLLRLFAKKDLGDRRIREHRASLRSSVDRLAQRRSFAESAARTIWGQIAAQRREPVFAIEYTLARSSPVTGYMFGVSLSNLVWARFSVLFVDMRQSGSVIGPPSPLPG